MNNKKKHHLINNEIRANEVRLAEDGRIISLSDAKILAESQSLDLVLINEFSKPPIVKIMNYEKYLYYLNKNKKNKIFNIKEIKLSYKITKNDLDYRIKHICEFLKKGNKVKLTMQFKGREISFIDIGKEIFFKLIIDIEGFGIPESLPKLEGKKLFCLIKPKKS
jgi:translation initiation factor IF-3